MIKVIKTKSSELSVEQQGGKICNLILDGVKLLGTYDRVDGKVGATHICVPNFASEGMEAYGLPFHGPARTLEWEIVKEDSKSLEIKVVLEALEKYKSTLEVRQVFRLDSSAPKAHQNDKLGTRHLALGSSSLKTHFHHEVRVKNIGPVAVPVNIAIHNYFDAPHGWEDAKLNGKSIRHEIENNLSVPISRHPTTSMVGSEILGSSPRMTSLLLLSPSSPSISIETVGARDIMCWTSVKDGKYNQDFACVEPVVSCDPNFFGSEDSLLPPGETRRLSQTISLL